MRGSADYSAITNMNVVHKKYVELDTTFFHDVYHVPKTPLMVKLVYQFNFDETKRLVELKGKNEGIFIIETKKPELYEQIEHIEYLGKKVAKVTVKTEKSFVDETGKTIRMTERNREHEILITLYRADTEDFEDISEDDIYSKIVGMGIGRVKKALAQQKYRDSEVLNGNKFFVLTVLKDGDIDKIPPSFEFTNGKKMWLNFKGKKRRCFFCSKFHEGECPL